MSPRAKKNPVNDTTRRRKGEGSITQRPDGRWVGYLELPRDPETGARRRKAVSGKTQREAVTALNAARAKLATGGDLLTKSPSLNEWLDFWFKHIASTRLRPNTYSGYESTAKHLRRYLGHVKLSALEVKDVRELHWKLENLPSSTGKPLGKTSIQQVHRLLALVLKDAVKEKKIDDNVALRIDAPRRAKVKSAALTPDEARRVLYAVANDRLGSRWAMALLTGARQGECLGLTWDRIDFDRRTIRIDRQLQRLRWSHGCELAEPGHTASACPKRHIVKANDVSLEHLYGGLWFTEPKTSAGMRAIPLVEPLRSILLRHRENTRNDPNPLNLVWTRDPVKNPATGETLPLDGMAIEPSRDSRAWHAVLARAGVRDLRLHDARHTAVTMFFNMGVDPITVQDIVGQSVLGVTLDYRDMEHAALQAPMIDAMTKLTSAYQLDTEFTALEAGEDDDETRLDDAA